MVVVAADMAVAPPTEAAVIEFAAVCSSKSLVLGMIAVDRNLPIVDTDVVVVAVVIAVVAVAVEVAAAVVVDTASIAGFAVEHTICSSYLIGETSPKWAACS